MLEEYLTGHKMQSDIYYPDFEAMIRSGIDAIWLTPKGERETRFSHPKNLYGWDCESVLIMNPNGISPEKGKRK